MITIGTPKPLAVSTFGLIADTAIPKVIAVTTVNNRINIKIPNLSGFNPAIQYIMIPNTNPGMTLIGNSAKNLATKYCNVLYALFDLSLFLGVYYMYIN